MMEVIRTSETTIYFYETTRRNIPEECHFYNLLKSFNFDYEISSIKIISTVQAYIDLSSI